MTTKSMPLRQTHKEAERKLRLLANPERARVSKSFFKTGKGEYGDGDRFLGATVPAMRHLAREFYDLPLSEIEALLKSPWHECRFLAVVLLVKQFEKAKTEKERKTIVDFYLRMTSRINNWDLVDVSTPQILGGWLLDKPRTILTKLNKSPSVWERRMSILATFAFIRKGQFDDAFRLIEALLSDRHDLIQKASGWMLREIGKRNDVALKRFLDAHLARMPRTTLRYAIERFPEIERKGYLLAGEGKRRKRKDSGALVI